MGLFSFFKRDDNYEQILSTLEQEIRRCETQRLACIARVDWCAKNWLFYMTVTWVAYLAGFIFYVWPDRYGRQAPVFLVHLVSVLLIPLFVYYGAQGIRSVGQRIVSRHDRRIVKLRNELKGRLDELKKKTAFDSTKTLIDRYSAGGGGSSAKPDEDIAAGVKPNAIARLKQQQHLMDAKNRRRTMPNFGTPGSHAATAGSVPTSPDAISGPSGLLPSVQPADRAAEPTGANRKNLLVHQQSPPPHFAVPETGVVKIAQHGAGRHHQLGQTNAAPAATAAPAARPWLDKLVDQLVGDTSGVDEKYALVCRHCYAHNGLVLVDEINDIQYTCPKCGKFNPSNRDLRVATSVVQQPPGFQIAGGAPQQQKPVETSDRGESGTTTTTHSRRDKSARYTADDDQGADSAPDSDPGEPLHRPTRAAIDSAQPMSAVTSDTDAYDLKLQRPKQRQQHVEEPQQQSQQPQQQKQQKTTPRKRKGAKAKRSL
ncbi:hypothetical protein GGI20_002136 [Coemansia sp. BCRC 34301]|nr:hypothetical protein GGI20_002136 [Coemansia sp. BCRC 34301]